MGRTKVSGDSTATISEICAMSRRAANLGIRVIPRQVSLAYVPTGSVMVILLNESWAKRRFAICFRDASDLQPAAAKMVDFLVKKGEAET